MCECFAADKLITLVMCAAETVQKLDATAAIEPDSDRGLHRAVIQPLHKSWIDLAANFIFNKSPVLDFNLQELHSNWLCHGRCTAYSARLAPICKQTITWCIKWFWGSLGSVKSIWQQLGNSKRQNGLHISYTSALYGYQKRIRVERKKRYKTRRYGARGRTWTGTGFPPRDFKSLVSTDFTTRAESFVRLH